MKKFLHEVIKLILGLLILAVALDLGLSWMYRKADRRSVLNYIKEQEFDIIVLGSSRAVHNIDAKLLSEETSLKVFNMGAAGNWPAEVYAYLSFFLEHNGKARMALIQIDNRYNADSVNVLASPPLIPYFGEPYLADYFEHHPHKNNLYIPLYRYIRYKDKSWRELLKLAMRNRNISIPNHGFAPYKEVMDSKTYDLSWEIINTKDNYTEKTIALCREHNIIPVFFTSPVNRLIKSNHNEVFSAKFNYYFDQSGMFSGCDTCFRDVNHILGSAAEQQTRDLLHKIQPIIEKHLGEK